jgi:hypothetical protein
VRSEDGRFDVGALWGWMGSSRETTNISLIFVQVYMCLQLDSEAKCELQGYSIIILLAVIQDYKPRNLNCALCDRLTL